jgi:hypothetical protein
MIKLRAAYGGAYIAWVDRRVPQRINPVDLVELRHRNSSPLTWKNYTAAWNRIFLCIASIHLRKTSSKLSRLRSLWKPYLNSD